MPLYIAAHLVILSSSFPNNFLVGRSWDWLDLGQVITLVVGGEGDGGYSLSIKL